MRKKESDTEERERMKGIKILLFCFGIVLQYHHTFTMVL